MGGSRSRFPHRLLPCLTLALAATLLLLSWHLRTKLPAHLSLCSPCLLALLLLGYFSVMAGTVMAAEWLPMLLLDLWGLFALLAILLSTALLGCSCWMQGKSAQIYDLQSASPLLACQGPFASGRQWNNASNATSPTAIFGLLSANLHAYSVLQAPGYELSPALFRPWP